MKNVEIIEIIEQLMELECLVINCQMTYIFIYKNYGIAVGENNIWLGENVYSYSSYEEGKIFYKKVIDYARRKVDTKHLKNLINQDYRKRKLLKINEL